MKVDTMYTEKERLVLLKHLDAFNLNPFAFMGILEDYITKVHPLPIKLQWEMTKKDPVKDLITESKLVELYIYAAGNVSTKRWGNPMLLDRINLELFMASYYQHARPAPIDFQVMNAISVHLRTPGISDSEKKNPMRNIKPWLKA